MNKIELSVIENAIFKVKTINIGATIYEILYKPKNNNLVLNLGSEITLFSMVDVSGD